jgi:glycerol-3-phosphate responsive antiterminator
VKSQPEISAKKTAPSRCQESIISKDKNATIKTAKTLGITGILRVFMVK